MADITVIDITEKNMDTYPKATSCFLNPKNEAYLVKVDWFKEQFKKGMKVKAVVSEEDKKVFGYIEYVPGEQAWRAVDAKGYMFIHCLWTNPKAIQKKGYGWLLLDGVEEDAKAAGLNGVAVVTSEGSFMAGKALFEKHGYESIATAKPKFNMMVKKFKKGALPSFRDYETQLKKIKGLQIFYTKQCPWVIRSIDECKKVAQENKLEIKITEFKTAAEAQNAPSLYASFNLVQDGKLLSDHYVSKKRFENIVKKELK